MKVAIEVIMLMVSLFLVLAVLLQESKSDGLSGSIGGGAEQLFGKKKSRGYDGMLHKATIVSMVLFFVSAIAGVFILR